MTFRTESRIGRTTAATGTRTRYATTRTTAVVGAVLWSTRLRRTLVRLGRRLRRIVLDVVTPAGWTALTLALGGTIAGLAFGWPDLAVAGVAALVLLALAVPFLFGAGEYRTDLHLTDERVVAGSEVVGTVRVTNVGSRTALPARLDIPVGVGLVEVEVPLLRPGSEFVEQLVVPAYRRGIVAVGPATSVRGDPVGVLRRARTWTDRSELFVHPRTISVPSTSAGFIRDLEGTPTTELVDSDISFHAIRDYAPGDSQRHIHWKSTAKTGALMVRQYEESKRSRIALLLDRRTDSYADADEFEMAVSVVGSLGVRAIRDGRDVTVMTGGEVPELVAESVTTADTLRTVTPRSLLDGLSGVELSLATPRLEPVCDVAVRDVAGMSLAMIVTGSNMGIRRLRAASLSFPGTIGVVAVLCDPQSEPSVRVVGELTIITIGMLTDLAHLMARGAAA